MPHKNAPAAAVCLDILCDQCGYNLRRSPLGGRCPECNYSVQESVNAYESRGDVGGLSDPLLGAVLMGVMCLTVLVIAGVVYLAEKQMDGDDRLALTACCTPLSVLIFWIGSLCFVPPIPHLTKKWFHIANYVRLAPVLAMFVLFVNVAIRGWALPVGCVLLLWAWVLCVVLIARRYADVAGREKLVRWSMVCLWVGVSVVPVSLGHWWNSSPASIPTDSKFLADLLKYSTVTLMVAFWILFSILMFGIASMIWNARKVKGRMVAGQGDTASTGKA